MIKDAQSSLTLTVMETLRKAYSERSSSKFGEALSPDFILWHNFDGREMSRAETLASAEQMFDSFSELEMEVRRQICVNDLIIQEHFILGKTRAGLQIEPVPSCIIAQTRGGLIVRIDEYVDPSPIVNALT